MSNLRIPVPAADDSGTSPELAVCQSGTNVVFKVNGVFVAGVAMLADEADLKVYTDEAEWDKDAEREFGW